MLYHPDLRITQLVVGAFLLVAHVAALLMVPALAKTLEKFPRSRFWGAVLLTVAAAWSLYLMVTMDLGEFTSKRTLLTAIVPIAYFLALFFVEEFLAVRALGMVLLLLACVPLDAAFLSYDPARLPLVVLAYAWIIAGLFMVGKPYLLRDAIGWLTARPVRLKMAAFSGILYGLLLIGIAVVRF